MLYIGKNLLHIENKCTMYTQQTNVYIKETTLFICKCTAYTYKYHKTATAFHRFPFGHRLVPVFHTKHT